VATRYAVDGTATPRPDIALLEHEEAQHNAAVIALLREATRDDLELTAILQALLDGYGKAGDIAHVTGIPVRDVYNALKRLGRKVIMVRQHLQERERPQQEERDHVKKQSSPRQH